MCQRGDTEPECDKRLRSIHPFLFLHSQCVFLFVPSSHPSPLPVHLLFSLTFLVHPLHLSDNLSDSPPWPRSSSKIKVMLISRSKAIVNNPSHLRLLQVRPESRGSVRRVNYENSLWLVLFLWLCNGNGTNGEIWKPAEQQWSMLGWICKEKRRPPCQEIKHFLLLDGAQWGMSCSIQSVWRCVCHGCTHVIKHWLASHASDMTNKDTSLSVVHYKSFVVLWVKSSPLQGQDFFFLLIFSALGLHLHTCRPTGVQQVFI